MNNKETIIDRIKESKEFKGLSALFALNNVASNPLTSGSGFVPAGSHSSVSDGTKKAVNQ